MAVPDTGLTVERVPPPVAYDLRLRVLRPGQPRSEARFPGDDAAHAAVFAARAAGGAVVGTVSVYPQRCPWRADRPAAWQLRAMATDPAVRSQGVGTRLLNTALAHVGAAGGDLVWCRARVPARRLYERAGFVAHGELWDHPRHGPHVDMALDLGPDPLTL